MKSLFSILILLGLFLSPANAAADIKRSAGLTSVSETNGLGASGCRLPTKVVANFSGAVIPECSGAVAAVAVSTLPPVQMASVRYLWALGQLESGNNDRAQGKAGEVSRFQCLASVWRAATAQPLAAATNAVLAERVLRTVIWNRTGKSLSELTPADFARAWHCPNAKHLNREQRDYVKRFENLCNQTTK